jgi:hypothetical protein
LYEDCLLAKHAPKKTSKAYFQRFSEPMPVNKVLLYLLAYISTLLKYKPTKVIFASKTSQPIKKTLQQVFLFIRFFYVSTY